MCILQIICIAPTFAAYWYSMMSANPLEPLHCQGAQPGYIIHCKCQKVRNNMDQLEQVTTCKICIVRRLLDEHLHKIACRYFFFDPIFACSMDSPQLLFNRTQSGLREHAQVDLRSIVSMAPIHLSLLYNA